MSYQSGEFKRAFLRDQYCLRTPGKWTYHAGFCSYPVMLWKSVDFKLKVSYSTYYCSEGSFEAATSVFWYRSGTWRVLAQSCWYPALCLLHFRSLWGKFHCHYSFLGKYRGTLFCGELTSYKWTVHITVIHDSTYFCSWHCDVAEVQGKFWKHWRNNDLDGS